MVEPGSNAKTLNGFRECININLLCRNEGAGYGHGELREICMECLDNDDDSDSELIGLVEVHADLLSGTLALLYQGGIKVILVYI